MKKTLTYMALLLVSGLVFSACIPKQEEKAAMDEAVDVMVKEETMESDEEAMMEGDVEDEMESDEEAMMEKADVEVSMEMGMFYFEPAVIEAEAGQTVTVNFTNAEGLHDFVIDELEVQSEQISSGEITSVTFTIPEDASGEEYEFYCSVMNHRAQGMVGTLMVK